MPASAEDRNKARILLALMTNQMTLDELETAYPDDAAGIRALYERLARVAPELFGQEGTVVTEITPPRPYTEPVKRLLSLGPPREGWHEPWRDLPALCGLTQDDVPELVRLAGEKDLYRFREEFPEADFGPLYAWRALGQQRQKSSGSCTSCTAIGECTKTISSRAGTRHGSGRSR